jgi:hypothetical protein
LGTMEERILKRMEEMLAAMSNQNSHNGNSAGEENSSRNKSRSGPTLIESGPFAPKLVKLNFPRYSGTEDPTSWICRAEQFFKYQNTAEEEKVSLAAFHLEGEAQLWY